MIQINKLLLTTGFGELKKHTIQLRRCYKVEFIRKYLDTIVVFIWDFLLDIVICAE